MCAGVKRKKLFSKSMDARQLEFDRWPPYSVFLSNQASPILDIFYFREGLLMHGLRNDFFCAIRSLKQHAGFWLIAVVTLALGIGANVSIFSVFNGVLLKPLPYPAPDQIVHCFTSHIERKGEFSNSAHDFADWRQLNHCFDSLASYRSTDLNYSGADQPIRGSTDHLFHQGLPVSLVSLHHQGEPLPRKKSRSESIGLSC